VDLTDLAPTPVGKKVVARAKLTAVDGRKLSFEFTVFDESAEVARGTHERVVVDRERFLGSGRA
jgi:fluoroacetyl-CoA thioesterase